MYKIKEKPEDFIVNEDTNIQPKDKGKYSLWWMNKKEITTVDSVRKIAKRLHLKERYIGFAGNKDKKAVTKQLISISMVSKFKIVKIDIEGIKLEFYGFDDKPISLGDLDGNNFEIIIRNLDELKDIENKKIKNFFGEQRFSKDNIEVGRAIVKKDFKTAASRIAESYNEVKEYLEIHETDYVGAIRKLPLKILKIYVHAYQSFLWNKAAEKIEDDIEIPLIGFDLEIDDKRVEEILEKIMKEEGINPRDFIIQQIPEISCEGGIRQVFVKPQFFEVLEKGEDEINKGKKKIRLKFFLPKGSYATEVIKQLFS